MLTGRVKRIPSPTLSWAPNTTQHGAGDKPLPGHNRRRCTAHGDKGGPFRSVKFCNTIAMMIVMNVAKEKGTTYTEAFTIASSISQSEMLQCSEDKFIIFRATWFLQDKKNNGDCLKASHVLSHTILCTVSRNRLYVVQYRG